MICQSCNQETEPGKFCTNCGATLESQEKESAAAAEPVVETVQQEEQGNQTPVQQQPQEPNEYVEKMKEVSANFGQFFLTLVKQPSEAKNTNEKSLIPSIITIVIFSLLIALNAYITIARGAGMGNVSFFDFFLVPLLKYIIMFAAIASITFAAAKIALQEVSITDVIAKYGAYLMPFVLLFIVGIFFNIIKLTQAPFNVVSTISVLGPVLIIPVLILTEKAVKGFDLVYTVLALSFVSYVIYGYLSKMPSVSSFLDFPW